ncbi:MAG TPA: hypothetical protein PKA00_15755 [Saprospiraceae bacterium]|nr:hypothetical protein [Saprospiraceae bacterium]HMQ84369.1 hypothetical protein [Saprospiraceae bacterium]
MKKVHFSIFILLCITAFCMGGCRKDDDEGCTNPQNPICPNYDPCYGLIPAFSDFVILDSVLSYGNADTSLSFIADTLMEGYRAYFAAKNRENIERYEWKIGSDPRTFEGPHLELDFYDFEGNVTVRLVTHAKNKNDCLNASELTDTAYQDFTVVDLGYYGSPIFGEYLGANEDNPAETYTVTLIGEGPDLWQSSRLIGLPIDCEYPYGILFRIGYNFFVSSHLPNFDRCRNIVVVGVLQPDGKTMKISYTYDDDDGKRVNKRFVGLRQGG